MINEQYGKSSKSLNVTEAQKRIARIIRDQQTNVNQQMPANEQTTSNMIQSDPQFNQAMKKRSSQ